MRSNRKGGVELMSIDRKEIPRLSDIKTRGMSPVVPEGQDWRGAHLEAALSVGPVRTPARAQEAALVQIANGVTAYLRVTQAEHGSIFDGVLNPAMADVVKGWRALLAGERGRLDGGTCDRWAVEILTLLGEEDL